MSTVWFDSNAVDITTAEYDLTKFSEHALIYIFTVFNALIELFLMSSHYSNKLSGPEWWMHPGLE